MIAALEDYGTNVTIYDPWANAEEVKHEYGLESSKEIPVEKFDAIILGVAHKEFLELDLNALKKEKAVVYDVKGILNESDNYL